MNVPLPFLPVQQFQSELDPIERQIHAYFDQLIECVQQRRVDLLNTYKDKRDEVLANRATKITKEEELYNLRTGTESRMEEVEIREVLRQIVAEIDYRLAEVGETQPVYRMVFWGDYTTLTETINELGVVYREEIPIVVEPLVATARRGDAPGQINHPSGVAICDTTKRVYVAEGKDTRRISVFTETGEFVGCFKHGDLTQPHGIATHGEDMYVTDTEAHKVFHFKLTPEIRLVNSLGSMGAGNGQFSRPLGISVSPDEEVLVADWGNNRIQILDKSLHFKRVMGDSSMYQPTDVKLTPGGVLVLCNTSPCIHVYSQAGERVSEIVTLGLGCDVASANFFCLDTKLNIIVSDTGSDQVRTFSPEGIRLRSIGGRGDQLGQFWSVRGICVNSGGKMAVVSYNPNCMLQIFSAQ